ncbi:MAG TPA: hypothetical protein VF796_15450, partial [Humisphaera sp.]
AAPAARAADAPADPFALASRPADAVGNRIDADANSGDLVAPVYLQPVNPASRGPGETALATRPAQNGLAATGVPAPPRLRSFELPAVEVVGERLPELKEEERVGPAGQPRWTADRRFPGTRIYVVPEGTIEFEYWLRPTVPRHGATEFRNLWEVEVGLPYRLQLDLYFRNESVYNGESQNGQSVELRYAFADWGKIWGNPTLYVEWSRLENEPDAIEFKLLLGGELAPRWHWGVNLSDELETGGDRANEIELTAGVSYSLVDSKFSVGAEMELGFVDTHGHRGSYDEKFLFVGPCLQWRPWEAVHIDFAPLAGIALTGDSPRFRAYFVVGYEF